PHALLFLNSSRDPRDPPSFPTRRLPIYNLMTRRETVGQFFMLGFAGTSVSRDLADLLARYRPGGIILFSRNLETPAQIVRLTNRSEEHTSELQSRSDLVCRLLLEKKNSH